MQKTLRQVFLLQPLPYTHTHTHTHIQWSPIIGRVWDSTPSVISLPSALYCTSAWFQGFICSQLSKINFYWNTVASQYCVSFCGAAKWVSYTYAYTHSTSDCLPTRIATQHCAEFAALYSRSSLVIYMMVVCRWQPQTPNVSHSTFS